MTNPATKQPLPLEDVDLTTHLIACVQQSGKLSMTLPRISLQLVLGPYDWS